MLRALWKVTGKRQGQRSRAVRRCGTNGPLLVHLIHLYPSARLIPPTPVVSSLSLIMAQPLTDLKANHSGLAWRFILYPRILRSKRVIIDCYPVVSDVLLC